MEKKKKYVRADSSSDSESLSEAITDPVESRVSYESPPMEEEDETGGSDSKGPQSVAKADEDEVVELRSKSTHGSHKSQPVSSDRTAAPSVGHPAAHKSDNPRVDAHAEKESPAPHAPASALRTERDDLAAHPPKISAIRASVEPEGPTDLRGGADDAAVEEIDEELEDIELRYARGQMRAFGVHQMSIFRQMQAVRERQTQAAMAQIALSRDLLQRRDQGPMSDEHASVVEVLKERERALDQVTEMLREMTSSVQDVSSLFESGTRK